VICSENRAARVSLSGALLPAPAGRRASGLNCMGCMGDIINTENTVF
jgi:hypothetical protein